MCIPFDPAFLNIRIYSKENIKCIVIRCQEFSQTASCYSCLGIHFVWSRGPRGALNRHLLLYVSLCSRKQPTESSQAGLSCDRTSPVALVISSLPYFSGSSLCAPLRSDPCGADQNPTLRGLHWPIWPLPRSLRTLHWPQALLLRLHPASPPCLVPEACPILPLGPVSNNLLCLNFIWSFIEP